ncbi:MAG: hypothetical protein LBR05_09395 [Azoarcus sp.]|jgi:hypothetical protein|nr:hypothetical protein [Azoarcus sp.]
MMTHIRFLFIVLLLLNVLVFGSLRGWFGDADPPDVTDPHRIEKQVYPERIALLGGVPPADPAQSANTPTCLAWAGLTDVQNNRLISLLGNVGIQARTRDVEVPATFKVSLPALPTREAAEILAENLSDGIDRTNLKIEENGPKKFTIVLNQFDTQAAADSYLETVKNRGAHNATITTRNVSEHRVEATAIPVRAEKALEGQPFATRHKPCR